MTTGKFQHFECLASRQLGQDRAARGAALAQGRRRMGSIGKGGGIMRGEYVFSQPNIRQIGADRIRAGVEADGAPLERETLTRWPVGGRGRRRRR